MSINLKGRSFVTLKDYTTEEIKYLLNLAKELKAKKKRGEKGDLLEGKNIVLLFEKTSTRTRCAFETAAYDEGAHVTFLKIPQMFSEGCSTVLNSEDLNRKPLKI